MTGHTVSWFKVWGSTYELKEAISCCPRLLENNAQDTQRERGFDQMSSGAKRELNVVEASQTQEQHWRRELSCLVNVNNRQSCGHWLLRDVPNWNHYFSLMAVTAFRLFLLEKEGTSGKIGTSPDTTGIQHACSSLDMPLKTCLVCKTASKALSVSSCIIN